MKHRVKPCPFWVRFLCVLGADRGEEAQGQEGLLRLCESRNLMVIRVGGESRSVRCEGEGDRPAMQACADGERALHDARGEGRTAADARPLLGQAPGQPGRVD